MPSVRENFVSLADAFTQKLANMRDQTADQAVSHSLEERHNEIRNAWEQLNNWPGEEARIWNDYVSHGNGEWLRSQLDAHDAEFGRRWVQEEHAWKGYENACSGIAQQTRMFRGTAESALTRDMIALATSRQATLTGVWAQYQEAQSQRPAPPYSGPPAPGEAGVFESLAAVQQPVSAAARGATPHRGSPPYPPSPVSPSSSPWPPSSSRSGRFRPGGGSGRRAARR